MPVLRSRALPVARTEDGIDIASASGSVWLYNQVGYHLVMHEPTVLQTQNAVSTRRRERVLQAVDIARHRLSLCHHLHCRVVDPKPVVYVCAGDLELDGLADDQIGSLYRPRPLRAGCPHDHARGSLRRTVGIR